jgi:nitroreductase
MPLLDLSLDELLITTRAVRKRLDLTRPVEDAVLRECLELAVQAPTGGNSQGWHFVIVTDAEKKKAISDLYRKSYTSYRAARPSRTPVRSADPEQRGQILERVASSSDYLADHMHEVPVLLIPCIFGRLDQLKTTVEQAGFWGSILPAVWNFMLAARARGLGTAWTTLHLVYEKEAAQVLGIPYEKITQVALIPVAYTLGTDFQPAKREPLDTILHVNSW